MTLQKETIPNFYPISILMIDVDTISDQQNIPSLGKTVFFRFMTGPGDIAISAEDGEMKFDITPLGHPARKTLTVTNHEGFSLRLIPEITGVGASRFTIIPSIAELPPGESFTFEIQAAARSLEETEVSMLRFIGANPNQIVYLISRLSETAGLVMAESKVDMGEVLPGHESTRRIRIANAGTSMIQVQIRIQPSVVFRLVSPSRDSFLLSGLTEEDVEIAYAPLGPEESHQGTLTVQDENGSQKFTVDLVGTCVPPKKTSPDSASGGNMAKQPIEQREPSKECSPSLNTTTSTLTEHFVEWHVYPRIVNFKYLNRPAYLCLSNTSDRDLCFSLTVPSGLIWTNNHQHLEELKVPARSFAQLKFLAKEPLSTDKPSSIVMTLGQQSRHVPVMLSSKGTRSKYHHSTFHSNCGTWSSSTHYYSSVSIGDGSFHKSSPDHELRVYPTHLHFRDSLVRRTTTDYLTIENLTDKVQRWRCIPIAPAYVKQRPSTPSSPTTAIPTKMKTSSGELIRKVEREVFVLESRNGILAPRSAIRIPVLYTPYISGTYLQFFQIQMNNDQVFRLEISGKATTINDRMNRRVRVAQPRSRQTDHD